MICEKCDEEYKAAYFEKCPMCGAFPSSPCSTSLPPNDGARVPQPNHKDLWDAYVAGAKSARQRPSVTDYQIGKAADAYCKLFHARTDPEGFAAFGLSNVASDLSRRD